MESESLALLQESLLEALAAGASPEETIARLSSDPRLVEYADYVRSWEPRMLHVAAELLAKWGVSC